MNNSLYGNYRTRTFCDIWNSETSFETDFKESPFAGSISDENINLLYYLLYEYLNKFASKIKILSFLHTSLTY